MPAPTLARSARAASSLFSMVLWRFAAALLYATSLLLIPHDLPAAVFTLLAALMCLPGARAAIRRYMGLRIGGVVMVTAVGVVVLLLCAVVWTGLQSEAQDSSGDATGLVVVSRGIGT